MYRTTLLALVLVSFTGCKKKPADDKPADDKPPAGSGTAMAPAIDAPAAVPVVVIDAAAAAAAGGLDAGELKTPESVLYDAGRDMYMVSNIRGTAAQVDDNGYLTVVNPDGSNERANANWKWIDGEADDIKLDAPKGMAISGDTLYVADITVVRRFEAKSGKQLDDIEIEGASFLNDVTPDGAGGVFVSDSGLGADFKPTGSDAVYQIDKAGKVTPRIKDKTLGNPNGVWSDGRGSVWVVTFGTGEIYEVDAKGKRGTPHKLPKGQLDGVVRIEGGDFIVSSWAGWCVFRGKPGGEWTTIVKDIKSPADLDYDPKRKRLLIPGFTTNQLHVHQL